MIQRSLLKSLAPIEGLLSYKKQCECHVIPKEARLPCPCSRYIRYENMEGFYIFDTIRTGTHAICN